MRFVTEANSKLHGSTLYLEDPETNGIEPGRDTIMSPIGRVAVALHYAIILQKLGLSLLAASLDVGFAVTEEVRFTVPVWECLIPGLSGRKFIGGYWPRGDTRAAFTALGTIPNEPEELLVLGHRHYAFVGLDFEVAQRLRYASSDGWDSLDDLPVLDFNIPRPSQTTWLSDGTITGPLGFFQFVGLMQLERG
jgi:hypothetical protein